METRQLAAPKSTATQRRVAIGAAMVKDQETVTDLFDRRLPRRASSEKSFRQAAVHGKKMPRRATGAIAGKEEDSLRTIGRFNRRVRQSPLGVKLCQFVSQLVGRFFRRMLNLVLGQRSQNAFARKH